MNYLAHLLLSGPEEDTRLGGLIGDFMTGQAITDFAASIQVGIERHRAIDRLTDRHPVFRRSRERLPASVRRFSGIIIDVCYDHFLAVDWDRWNPKQSLREFTREIYAMLSRRESELPPRLQRALPWIVGEDWLASYADLDHLERVFAGMSRRLRRENPLAEGARYLADEYELIGEDFAEFFADLQASVAALEPRS